MYQPPQRGPTGLGVTDRSPRPVHLLHHHPGGTSLALLGRIHGKTGQHGISRTCLHRFTVQLVFDPVRFKKASYYVSVLQVMLAGFTGVFVRPSRSAAVVSTSIIRHARCSAIMHCGHLEAKVFGRDTKGGAVFILCVGSVRRTPGWSPGSEGGVARACILSLTMTIYGVKW